MRTDYDVTNDFNIGIIYKLAPINVREDKLYEYFLAFDTKYNNHLICFTRINSPKKIVTISEWSNTNSTKRIYGIKDLNKYIKTLNENDLLFKSLKTYLFHNELQEQLK